MVLIRRIHNRGATVVVEAHGEVLFAPTGPVGNWTRRFSNRLTAFAAQEAPTNKRPRWAHYGKPLKSTMTSSTTYQPGRFKVYAAVGSTAPHALFVDQGTGIYGGGGAYEAKILPPWQHGSASLYEATWRPEGPGHRRVRPVMIRGQKGQHFFDKALSRAFASMRMRAFQVPTDAKISGAISSAPASVTNFLGSTNGNGGAFRAQLEEWRLWRDEAWSRGEGLGRGGGIGSPAQERFRRAAAEAREARLAARGQGRAAYRASLEAAERRKREQIAKIREAEHKRRAAEARRQENEAKERANQRLTAGNAASKRQAEEFLSFIKSAYPDARMAVTPLSDGTILYRVRYTGPGGQVITESWAYGYDV